MQHPPSSSATMSEDAGNEGPPLSQLQLQLQQSQSQQQQQQQQQRRHMSNFNGNSNAFGFRGALTSNNSNQNPNNPNYNGTNTQYGLPDYGNTNYGQDCSGVNIDRKDLIDSALIAALRDPKERDALLHLETALVQFMQSPAGWVEVSGPYNSQFWTGGDPPTNMKRERHSSFQRCVLHRLADRFWIIREPGQSMGALRLIKVPNSAVPPVLLSHLTEIEVTEALSRINMAPLPLSPPPPAPSPFSYSFAASLIVPASTAVAATAEPTTMKIIMKRTNSQPTSMDDDEKLGPNGTGASNNSNNNNNNNNNNSGKTSTSISDKEKAYAAARARIFNEQPSTSTTPIAEHAASSLLPSSSTTSSSFADAADALLSAAGTKLTAAAPVFVPKQQTPASSSSSSYQGDDVPS
jgi:SUZ domain